MSSPNSTHAKYVILLASGILLAGGSHLAYAQASADPAVAAPTTGVEEIVVTSRKRTEKLQDVPVAISVVSAASLQQQDITRIEDIARMIPGFSYSESGGRQYNRPFIRGITTTSGEFYQQKVKTFLDGVLIAGSAASSTPFDELAQVEVLKGPQATAFGRGVIGGAISYVTKEPTDYFSGTISAEERSHDETNLNAFISGPLIEGILKGYIDVKSYNYGGPGINNSYDGSRLGTESSRYVSSKAVLTPNDWLTVKAYGSYDMDRDGFPTTGSQALSSRADITTARSLALTGSRTYLYSGAVTDTSGGTYFPNNQIGDVGLKRESYRLALTVSADLGFATLTSISAMNQEHETNAYNSGGSLDAYSSTGTLLPGFGGGLFGLEAFAPATCSQALGTCTGKTDYTQYLVKQNYKDVQQEFRLVSSNEGPLKWMTGVNYINYWQFENYVTFPQVHVYRTNSYSFYGSLSYDILDDLTVTAEGRYNVDNQGQNDYNNSAKYIHSANYYRFLPRAAIDYHFTPDVSVYGLFSEGSSPGFFNANVLPGGFGENVGEEILYNYEAGIKSRWFENQLLANVAIYEEDYKNQQLLVNATIKNTLFGIIPGAPELSTLPLYVNAPGTITRGVEVELRGAPEMIPGLELGGTAAFTQAKFQNYCSTQAYFLNPSAAPTSVMGTGFSYLTYNGCNSVKDNFLPYQPEWMASLSASYTHPLSADWIGRIGADWSYIGRKFGSETNVAWTPASEIVNLHVGVETQDVKIDAFVLNATGEDAPVFVATGNSGQANAAPTSGGTNHFSSIVNSLTMQKPRQFGIKVSYSWGASDESETVPPAAYTAPAVVAPIAAPKSYLVFFDFNKSDLSSQATTIVDTAAKNAAASKATRLEVTGHTDTVGSDAYNMRLSRRRAESVAAQLEKDGIASSEIEIVAKGKRDLLVPTADGVKEPQNRRVQIVYQSDGNS